MSKYILIGNWPYECDDVNVWAQWFEKTNRTIAIDDINNTTVSTVFLGLDHSYKVEPPMLFETMIFGGEHDQYQDRHSTYTEAIAGHKYACDLVKGNSQ